MRVQAARAVRVGPGDAIIVRGQLPRDAKLSRLYVFSSENGGPFSPYVHGVTSLLPLNGKPQMMAQPSLRLIPAHPVRELSFISDIDGFICVVQEVDSADDPRAKIRIMRKINSNLGWVAWLKRMLAQWQTAPKFT